MLPYMTGSTAEMHAEELRREAASERRLRLWRR